MQAPPGARPTFFFSHARQDREGLGQHMLTFFKDLEWSLAQWAAFELSDKKRLGTIDQRIQQGENWDQRLSAGLCTDRALIALMTPLYFTRANCGKELMVFLRRHPGLNVDPDGALTGVTNILPIRWLPAAAYATNGIPNAVIPPILWLIEDTPADPGDDEERTKAIERYRRKGMARCIGAGAEPYYSELMTAFVERLTTLGDLDPAPSASFATTEDAFAYDWLAHFEAPPTPPGAGPPGVAIPPGGPTALNSIVAFYLTHRPFVGLDTPVDFADTLITEQPGTAPAGDADFAALLTDMRVAAAAEGFVSFHAVAGPATLLQHLIALSARYVMTVVVVDPAVWSGSVGEPGAPLLEEIARSSDWTGLLLLPAFGSQAADAAAITALRGLPARLLSIPEQSNLRVEALRHAYVEARGRVLRAAAGQMPGAERVPLLRNAPAERP